MPLKDNTPGSASKTRRTFNPTRHSNRLPRRRRIAAFSSGVSLIRYVRFDVATEDCYFAGLAMTRDSLLRSTNKTAQLSLRYAITPATRNHPYERHASENLFPWFFSFNPKPGGYNPHGCRSTPIRPCRQRVDRLSDDDRLRERRNDYQPRPLAF